jgi:hypothetical protein
MAEHRRTTKAGCAPTIDELSPFRYFSKKAKRLHCTVPPEIFRDMWIQQKGLCAVSGKSLLLPRTVTEHNNRHPLQASIDRIDSSKGYVVGNMRFVALIVNYALSTWDDEVLEDLAKAIVQHRA